MNEEITKDNLEKVNISKIALNKEKFGSLTFDSIYPKLEDLKEIFADFKKLSYETMLPEQAPTITSYFDSFVERLNWLRNFDPSVSGDITGEKNNFEQSIKDLYTNVFTNVLIFLTHLRQRAYFKSPRQKELTELQNEAQKAKLEYEDISKDLKEKIDSLKSEKEQVAKTKGEIAAKTTGKYFESQAVSHAREKRNWAKWRYVYFFALLFIIIVNLVVYLILFIYGDVKKEIPYRTTSIFTIPYAILKVALISILSYAISFASKNFRINSHLESVNKHRKNVAETLNDFLGANPTPEDRSIMLQQGVEAMFRHLSTGYDNHNDSKEDTGPVHEIVQFVPKIKGPSL